MESFRGKASLLLLGSLAVAGCGGGGSEGGDGQRTGANLSINIVDDVDPAIIGRSIRYTITVSNAGPETATNVLTTNTLSAGVTQTSTVGCGNDPSGLPSCALGNIPPGATARYSVFASIDGGASGVLTNTASVTAAQPDPDQTANTASQTTALVAANTAIGMQQFDIRRDPVRRAESAMGNMVADAMRSMYPGAEAAFTNSGGLRQDLLCASSSGEPSCVITHGELFAVLPFGNLSVVLTLTGAQLEQAFLNGLIPRCDSNAFTGPFPQISGMRVTFTCNGLVPVVTGMWKTPSGIGGPETSISATDTIRLVTNDFMYGGGDFYAVLAQGTNVVQPGDNLLRAVTAFISVNSPVGPLVEGRIVGP